MHRPSQRVAVPGTAGAIECAIDEPPAAPVGVAVICHPHPQHGGTMDNKVVQTLARAFVGLGWRAVRFNFRGVGESAGDWDHGRGEVDDALAVTAAERDPNRAFALCGFSFGGYVAAAAAHRLREGRPPDTLVLVAPATSSFECPPASAARHVAPGKAIRPTRAHV